MEGQLNLHKQLSLVTLYDAQNFPWRGLLPRKLFAYEEDQYRVHLAVSTE